jgi:hypothetical protein
VTSQQIVMPLLKLLTHCCTSVPCPQEKKAKEREAQQEEEQADMDPDMMALMGFGGFGTSKK